MLDGPGPIDLASAALTDLREGRPADAAALHRMAMSGNPALYFDYVAALLHQDPQRALTADIAPEYARLSVETLTELRRELEARGIRVVPVFVSADGRERVDTWDAVFGDEPYATALGTPPQNV